MPINASGIRETARSDRSSLLPSRDRQVLAAAATCGRSLEAVASMSYAAMRCSLSIKKWLTLPGERLYYALRIEKMHESACIGVDAGDSVVG